MDDSLHTKLDIQDDVASGAMADPSTSKSPTQTIVQERLSSEIREAIHSTGQNMSHWFLPGLYLTEIFRRDALVKLFEELFGVRELGKEIDEPAATKDSLGIEVKGQSAELYGINNKRLEQFVDKTLRKPSRTPILALFLYDPRPLCLVKFKSWLSDDKVELPELPWEEDMLNQFHLNDAEYLKNNQAIFMPFTIEELAHQTLPFKSRKPFVDTPKKIGGGAAGTVYAVKIAAGHWKYKKEVFQNIIATPEDCTVAMKVFYETEDFETERDNLKELREMNNISKTILLDLGSITETNETGGLVHHLFFERAQCDLGAFFTSNYFAEKYKVKSDILSKAVDILDALVYLHGAVRRLHLDIKPDNILVFEYPTASDEDKLIWKITDFDLSRNKIIKSSNPNQLEMSNARSTESTVPSVREAGLYQAPEINSWNISPASEGSDVWSMGGILLELLAFLHGGPEEVRKLRSYTKVHFKNRGGERSLFYVNNNMIEWPKSGDHPLEYLNNFKPAVEIIGENVEATMHPDVMRWSTGVYDETIEPERQCLKQALGIIFEKVLLVDRHKRFKALDLHRNFVGVRNSYKKLEEVDDQSIGPRDLSIATLVRNHSKLCSAISINNFTEVNKCLVNPEPPGVANEPCPQCRVYPIHKALENEDYEIIEAVVKRSSKDTFSKVCPQSGQTPIAIACEGPGDRIALQHLFKYRKDDITIAEETYGNIKNKLGTGAKALVKQHMVYQRSKDLSRQQTRDTQLTGRSGRSLWARLRGEDP